MTEIDFIAFDGSEHSPHWSGAAGIRWDVFVVEQQVPMAVEIDARDFLASTTHLVGLSDRHALATCRILADGNDHFHLGRVAVRREARGLGLGRAIIAEAARAVQNLIPSGDTGQIVLDAQIQAQGFYEESGYRLTERPAFLDAGIWHREMSKVVFGIADDLL